MNKSTAKKITEVITYEQLLDMFNEVKANTKNWSAVSNVNKSISKGAAWNILYPSLRPGIEDHKVIVTNMIREFGEYLPEELKPTKPAKEENEIHVHHQEPRF